MSDGKKYYCFCSSNCKYETMTKEQILSAITQAASGESVIDPDASYISRIRETNTGANITFWVGTQAQYNALQGNTEQNCLYIITDDTLTREEIERLIGELQQGVAKAEQAVASVTSKELSAPSGFKVTSAKGFSGRYPDGNITTRYIPALELAHLKACIEIKAIAKAARGTTISLQLPAGLFQRMAYMIPDALTAMGNTADMGRISACMNVSGEIEIRFDDGFTIEDGYHFIYLTGWYACNGGLTE
jgi:hypothetical protein